MPVRSDLPDDDLLVIARTGDREAATALVDRHVDAVHDHLARWSQDGALAASATIDAVTALFEPNEPLPAAGVRAWLVERGRSAAVGQLRGEAESETSRLAPAVLATTGPDGPDHDSATAVWTAAATLDDHRFTVLDLSVRQGLDDASIAAVTGDSVPDVVDARDRAERGIAGSADDPIGVYAELATLRAPVSVRRALEAVLSDRYGPLPRTSSARIRPLAIGAVTFGALLTVIGLASGLRTDPVTVQQPPAVVAETVQTSPSPSPSPSAGPTLEALASPTSEPSPDPTPTASPTPEGSPSPSASPDPETPAPLAVTLDSPVPGTAVVADEVDELGREIGFLEVAASATGPEGILVRWSTDLAPDVSLLDAEDGTVALWLADPCQDTAHPLRVTVTDPETGESASEVTQVVARHTCAAPLQVGIEAPTDGATVAISGVDAQGRPVAEVNAVATPTQDDGIAWAWTSDEQPGEVLLERASGTLQLINDSCDPVTHLVTVDAVRDSDGSGGSASVTVTVEPAPGCIP